MKWFKTQFPGVRYREHPTRKHGVRKDRYYALHYKVNGKVIDAPWGWASEGKTAEGAFIELNKLKKNAQSGNGPVTLKEQKAKNEAEWEAEKARLKAEAAAQRTLSEYWQESYFPAAQQSKKRNSWIKEDQHFRLWIGPLLGALPLRTIGLPQWDELIKKLSTAGLTARSKEYITGTLRRILKHAYDRRMINDAPPTGKRVGVTGPGNNRRLRVISPEEEAAILQYLSVSDPHAWRFTRFCFLTGCRVSEAMNLTWAGVNFSMGTITFHETKNHDSRRIPITPMLMDLLTEMDQGTPDSHVFTHQKNGNAYQEAPSAFSTAVDNLGYNAGRSKRDRIVFHSIRHSVATRLAQRLGLRDLMDVMGWRTVQMAMRYVHSNEGAKMKALSMLGASPATADNVLPFRAGENVQAGTGRVEHGA